MLRLTSHRLCTRTPLSGFRQPRYEVAATFNNKTSSCIWTNSEPCYFQRGEQQQQQQRRYLSSTKEDFGIYRTRKNFRDGHTFKKKRISTFINKKDINEENNIYSKIRNCKTLKELLDLQQQCQKEVQLYQIPSYWNKVKLIIMDDASELQKLRRHNRPELFLKPLVDQTLDYISELNDPRTLSTMIHAIAKISIKTRNPISEELWKVLEEKVCEQAEKSTTTTTNFSCRHCANILWSFAKMNRKSDMLFNTIANNQLLSNVHEFDSEGLTTTVWAYAKAGHRAPILFHAISNVAIKKLDTFDSQSLAKILWSYARLRHTAAPQLFEAVSKKAIENIDTFGSWEMSNLVWACARAGGHNMNNSNPKLFDVVSRRAIQEIDSFNSQELANTVWAYAKVGHNCPELFDAAKDVTIEKLNTFKPQEISNMVWSFARAAENSATTELYDAVSHILVSNKKKCLHQFKPQELVNIAWSYAKAEHYSPKLFDAISHTAIQKLHLFNSQDIANITWAYAKTGYRAPELFDAISYRAITELDTFKAQEVASTVWAYARIGHLAPDLFDAVSHIAIKKLHTFQSHSMANTLWAYAKVGHTAPELFDAISQHFATGCSEQNLRNRFKAQEIASMLWAYTKVGYSAPELLTYNGQSTRRKTQFS